MVFSIYVAAHEIEEAIGEYADVLTETQKEEMRARNEPCTIKINGDTLQVLWDEPDAYYPHSS
jgi:hypothetical protein